MVYTDSECSLEDLPGVTEDRDEREREICAVCVIWWYVHKYISIHRWINRKKFMKTFRLIYIYIYIIIHRQICFVLSELISVARRARFPKLGSKPSWLKRQSKILPFSHEEASAGEINLNGYGSQLSLFTYPLNGYRELYSYIYIYIYTLRKTTKPVT